MLDLQHVDDAVLQFVEECEEFDDLLLQQEVVKASSVRGPFSLVNLYSRTFFGGGSSTGLRSRTTRFSHRPKVQLLHLAQQSPSIRRNRREGYVCCHELFPFRRVTQENAPREAGLAK